MDTKTETTKYCDDRLTNIRTKDKQIDNFVTSIGQLFDSHGENRKKKRRDRTLSRPIWHPWYERINSLNKCYKRVEVLHKPSSKRASLLGRILIFHQSTIVFGALNVFSLVREAEATLLDCFVSGPPVRKYRSRVFLARF